MIGNGAKRSDRQRRRKIGNVAERSATTPTNRQRPIGNDADQSAPTPTDRQRPIGNDADQSATTPKDRQRCRTVGSVAEGGFAVTERSRDE
jgi:hypothetical protein